MIHKTCFLEPLYNENLVKLFWVLIGLTVSTLYHLHVTNMKGHKELWFLIANRAWAMKMRFKKFMLYKGAFFAI